LAHLAALEPRELFAIELGSLRRGVAGSSRFGVSRRQPFEGLAITPGDET
jgi:hypothetical protein